MTALQQLLKLLHVTPSGEGQFIGKPGAGDFRIYGGLILTQAIDAARQCCPADFALQSLHGQFLRPGDYQHDIEIRVEDLKQGRRFKLYNVYCQQQGKTIFFATVTFHLPEDSFEHTQQAPGLTLPTEDKARLFIDRTTPLPDDQPRTEAALELRIEEINQFDQVQMPEQVTWFKTASSNKLSDWQQTLLLAYCSDWNMPIVAARPHTLKENQRPNIASLDHSIWFYRQADLSHWTAYVQESPAALNGRGHTRGLLYSEQGELLACVNQECFMVTESKE